MVPACCLTPGLRVVDPLEHRPAKVTGHRLGPGRAWVVLPTREPEDVRRGRR